MPSVAASRAGWIDSACPTWFAPVPEKVAKTDKEVRAGDWFSVKMIKRDSKGEVVSSKGSPEVFQFHLENLTGDLYGVQHAKERIDKRYEIAVKAMGMFFATPLYTFGMMTTSSIRITINTSAIFWRIIPQFAQDIYRKGFFASIGNTTMRIVWETPTEIVNDIWRIVRSPIYGIGMMMACVFTIVSPLEGRKWLGKIEYEWHERVSYQMDIRHKKSRQQIDDFPFLEFISEVAEGKVFYLGYCMQKRGNVNEKIAGKPRFEMFGDYQKKI